MNLLSDDIRMGIMLGVVETKFTFMEDFGDVDTRCGCALGTAAYARGWMELDWEMRSDRHGLDDGGAVKAFHELYPAYPIGILWQVSDRHSCRGWSRLRIADWLENEIEPALGLRPKKEAPVLEDVAP